MILISICRCGRRLFIILQTIYTPLNPADCI